jgi:transcription elongation GreA/GreB family factor
MSVAFTKEDSAETAAETVLPDRPISPEPNLVTATGLAMLEAAFAAARIEHEAAAGIEDVNERRRQGAASLRDLRYYSERLRTAQLMPDPLSTDRVSFGSTVTVERDDGRTMRYRIVGEDEASPQSGTISYISPLARAVMGKSVGDVVTLGERELELVAIT